MDEINESFQSCLSVRSMDFSALEKINENDTVVFDAEMEFTCQNFDETKYEPKITERVPLDSIKEDSEAEENETILDMTFTIERNNDETGDINETSDINETGDINETVIHRENVKKDSEEIENNLVMSHFDRVLNDSLDEALKNDTFTEQNVSSVHELNMEKSVSIFSKEIMKIKKSISVKNSFSVKSEKEKSTPEDPELSELKKRQKGLFRNYFKKNSDGTENTEFNKKKLFGILRSIKEEDKTESETSSFSSKKYFTLPHNRRSVKKNKMETQDDSVPPPKKSSIREKWTLFKEAMTRKSNE